jgi:hypothetical protein
MLPAHCRSRVLCYPTPPHWIGPFTNIVLGIYLNFCMIYINAFFFCLSLGMSCKIFRLQFPPIPDLHCQKGHANFLYIYRMGEVAHCMWVTPPTFFGLCSPFNISEICMVFLIVSLGSVICNLLCVLFSDSGCGSDQTIYQCCGAASCLCWSSFGRKFWCGSGSYHTI